ncbi:MAG: CocE/NonD family hydrolase [Mycetocola sp.]
MTISPNFHFAPNPSGSDPYGPTLLDATGPDSVRTWLTYDRPSEYESITTRAEIPLRDGTVLVGTLRLPGNNGEVVVGEFPALLNDFTPYDQSRYSVSQLDYFAERGYAVLMCNVRGSGESGGEFEAWFPAREAEDNFDIIEWLAAQPFCNGRVGQRGASYGSVTAYRVAALRPPHLEAIVPIVSPTDIYSEWVRPGGVPTIAASWWSSNPVLSNVGHASTLQSFQEHPTYDAFWDQAVTTNKIAQVEVPALHIGGYYDIFKNGGFDALRQRPEKTWLLYGPWIHLVPLVVPGSPSLDPSLSISEGVILQWFDRWLKDLGGAALPPARVVSFEDASESSTGAWTQNDQWPPAGAVATRYYPAAHGELSASEPQEGDTEYFVNSFDGPSSCVIGCRPTEPSQNQMMAEMVLSNQLGRRGFERTTFTTPAFTRDTVVSGPVALNLTATLSADDTYFVSKLETVLPDGRVLPVETGYLRAQMRTTLREAEVLTPGVAHDYRIELGQTHFCFRVGERLRVTISGGDVPFVLPTSPAGRVTVHHGAGTYLELPLAVK